MEFQQRNQDNLLQVVMNQDYLLYLRLNLVEFNNKYNSMLNVKVLIGIKMD